MLHHTPDPDTFLLAMPGVWADAPTMGFDRSNMTSYLLEYIDLLEVYGRMYTIAIEERFVPQGRLRFLIYEEDEWEAEKAKFSSLGLVPVAIDLDSSFSIDHEGERKQFSVKYTVIHETTDGSELPGFGSAALPHLLTNSHIQPGLFTYAHIQCLP